MTMTGRATALDSTVPQQGDAGSVLVRADRGISEAHVAASNDASGQFFSERADAVARACHAMARRFQRGGRLIAYGEGAQRSDVAHVVVEFVHPVIVGKRALPAMALPEMESCAALESLGHSDDILMLFCAGTPGPRVAALLLHARECGMLALVLTGERSSAGDVDGLEFHFAVPSADALVVQETHEMLYHVLWELVHVFLDHRGGDG